MPAIVTSQYEPNKPSDFSSYEIVVFLVLFIVDMM